MMEARKRQKKRRGPLGVLALKRRIVVVHFSISDYGVIKGATTAGMRPRLVVLMGRIITSHPAFSEVSCVVTCALDSVMDDVTECSFRLSGTVIFPVGACEGCSVACIHPSPSQ